ncbi:alkaline phosphatase D family protein [Streptomyces adelaidensis]|uniref:alkaline phosphatase D family protein n=1 Tax=Streptomyces adelaidensis TaxID=2796465 RepID=UPI0019052E03|nr:alkaline phosphatase D family protein [Streptomyces adelaidensis]
MTVTHVWAGATTDTSAWVRGKVTGASTRLAVSLSAALSAPTYFGPVVPTADGIASLQATGLQPGIRYYYALEDDGVLDTAFSGTFRTHPVAAGERASFAFGAAGDAGLTGDGDDSYVTSAVSDNPVFDTMRAQSAAEDWLFFSHLGDFHYRNIATATAADYRAGYNDSLTFNGALGAAARQGRFYRDNPLTYVWDDHDFGPNNSDRTAAGNATANSVYRERVPHYTLPSASTINQSWQVGRILFIASDVRSARDPNSDPQSPTKTMLGSAQKTWMESVLTADTGAEALVWISPSRWLADGTGTDTWNSFLHERDEVIDLFGDTGWLDKMIQLTADMHALSICSGPGNPWGGFPIYMFASMDSGSWSEDPLYDIGSTMGRQQYGTMQVRDRGHTIELGGTGWINGTAWKSHTAYVHVGNPVLSLDFDAGHVKDPFRPTVGTGGTVNDFTAKRQDGGEARFVKTDGPRGTDAIGTQPDSATVQVASDDQLGDQASWRVHLGTSPDARIPEVHIDLAKAGNTTTVADAVAGASLGDAMAISNPPDDLPPDDVQLIVEGYSERIGEFEWDWQANTSPGRPWNIGSIPVDEASAGPDQPNRWDTSGSQLVSDATAGATEMVVHTPPDGVFERMPWIISDGPADAPNLHPTHFPMRLALGGEDVTVTSCVPYAWDTFDRTSSNSWGTSNSGHAWQVSPTANAADFDVASGVGTIGVNAVNSSRRVYLPSSLVLADVDVKVQASPSVLAAAGNIETSIMLRVDPADIGNTYYYGEIEFNFAASRTVRARIVRRQAGVDTALSTAFDVPGLVYTAGSLWWIRFQAIGTALRLRVWEDGTFEPAIWHVDVADSALTSGRIGLRAILDPTNTNALPVLTNWDKFEVLTPQRMTVQRAWNQVSKPHAAGAPVSLAQPAPLGL